MKKEYTKKKMIKCQRCGKPAPYRINKKYCSEYCRKLEEKKRYRFRQKERSK